MEEALRRDAAVGGRKMRQLEEEDGRPRRLVADLSFSRPGKPTDNAFIVSFNSSERYEHFFFRDAHVYV